ncbi:hotdog fold thioesterase [Parafilimonas terrae]|jgi:1,4-dihydroxy-2-naphthoyl-CoA hydrolase|uniref:1,4-dihydroxy-2-naphthoyl-CoA hydrolase n=1 Tax=Parafilimonas terrae TaxID=1465490 RepID=A0A1I5YR29_9BACT|nr:hotdog fold thioesterase [Parafilimonas terrae]SFQ46602.1 1,4-dihydroxy-2-naphthoyl-CoA hydrolase [Parafilimonas terrae]
MSIWYNKEITINDFEGWSRNTLADHLGIQFTELGKDYLKATMPVDERTHQPYGLLHGGASAALAETLGSVCSALVINRKKFICVGIEINANHIRSIKSGIVTGTSTPVHIGGSTHVWDIRIHDEHNRLICISRLTVAVLKKLQE